MDGYGERVAVVVVARDDELRAMLVRLLGRDPRISIIGATDDVGTAGSLASTRDAHILFMDWKLACECLPPIAARIGSHPGHRPTIAVLAETAREEVCALTRGLENVVIILKEAGTEHLIERLIEIAPDHLR